MLSFLKKRNKKLLTAKSDAGDVALLLPQRGGAPLIADIQILRAVAIIFVMVQHSLFNLVFDVPWLSRIMQHAQLWCGVDLFFVISGYLIAGGLLRAWQAAPARQVLWRFWLRRAFRLWPAAWFCLALMLLGSLVLTNPPIFNTFQVNFRSALAGVLAYANIRFAAHPFEPYGPSYPYWSLSLEEQFYAALPLVMLVCRRWLPWAMVLGIAVQFPLAHSRLFMFLRTDALLWGVLLACWARSDLFTRLCPPILSRWPGLGLVVLAAILALMVFMSPIFDTAPPYAIGIIAMAAAFAVWLAAQNRDIFHTGHLQSPLLWVGSRSYVLYLLHVPVFQCAAAISHHFGASDAIFGTLIDLRSTVICCPLLIAAAEFTHCIVEKPCRAYGKRLADRLAA